MKDSRYANRGATLEEFLRYANDRYAKQGIAVITKLPTEFIPIRDRYGKICSVKVEHKSAVDFMGRYKNIPIAIEAKHTSTDSIRFDEVQPHQADFMDDFTAQPGTIGLVVVSFKIRRFFAIPWQFWGAAYEVRARRGDRTARVPIFSCGQTWDTPCKFSARMDELNPAWEISGHDPKYGIHYLAKAEEYITTPQQ